MGIKFENLNPKSETNSNVSNPNVPKLRFFNRFSIIEEFKFFEFVSDFEIRISDFHDRLA